MANFNRTRKIVKIFTLPDWLLIIFFCFLAVLFFFKVDYKESKANVFYKNKLWQTIDLTENREITVDNGIVLQIKNNKLRVKESTCPHKYCVKQGWSNTIPIICVPNKLAIYFTEDENMLITR